jgi:transcriptional regulator of acetoin/glycerol metabolism
MKRVICTLTLALILALTLPLCSLADDGAADRPNSGDRAVQRGTTISGDESKNGDINKMIHPMLLDDTLSERDLLSRVLESTNWNRSRTSWILDVSEGTIRNWIKKHGLTKS